MDSTDSFVNIVYATESPLKKKAFQDAFLSLKEKIAAAVAVSGTVNFHFASAAAESGVNAQPIGWEETIKGANNRASHAPSLVQFNHPARAVLAIENGIVYISADGVGYNMDISWVVLKDLATGKQYEASSTGIPFPAEAVQVARERGFECTTVGEILHEQNESVCANDPHSALLGGILTRVSLMEQAVKACFGQWIVALREARKKSSE